MTKGRDDGLTDREREFCRHYVANNHKGGPAAVSAGYAVSSARVMASRLLKRPLIQAELERIRITSVNTINSLVIQSIDRGEIAPELAQVSSGTAANLTRAFQQHGLVKALAMALGEAPREVERVYWPNKDKVTGLPVAEPVVLKAAVRVPEPGTASNAAVNLGKELDRLEGVAPQGETIDGELAEEPRPVDAVTTLFREKYGLPPPDPDFDPDDKEQT